MLIFHSWRLIKSAALYPICIIVNKLHLFAIGAMGEATSVAQLLFNIKNISFFFLRDNKMVFVSSVKECALAFNQVLLSKAWSWQLVKICLCSCGVLSALAVLGRFIYQIGI